jgi:hypothetical protein
MHRVTVTRALTDCNQIISELVTSRNGPSSVGLRITVILNRGRNAVRRSSPRPDCVRVSVSNFIDGGGGVQVVARGAGWERLA